MAFTTCVVIGASYQSTPSGTPTSRCLLAGRARARCRVPASWYARTPAVPLGKRRWPRCGRGTAPRSCEEHVIDGGSADGGEDVATAIVDVLVPDGPPTERPLREALTSFLDGKGIVRPIRPEIAASWRRAASSGLQPDHFDPPYDPDVAQDSRLERAAAPVMDQLSADLAGTETGLLLTDHRGHVLDRRVSDVCLRSRLDHIQLAPGFFYSEESAGTNGIGSALAQREPAFIRGGEHFADALTDMACAGAPITDARNGQVLGVIDVSCSVRRGNPLMLPFAKRAAYEIEQRLLEGTSVIERFLYQRFLDARRRAKGPLALVGKHTMLANTAAARVLEAADQDLPVGVGVVGDTARRAAVRQPPARKRRGSRRRVRGRSRRRHHGGRAHSA